MREEKFEVTGAATLVLADLFASVVVRRGDAGRVCITMDGTEKQLADIVTKRRAGNEIHIRGAAPASNGVVAGVRISRGGSIVATNIRAGGSISIVGAGGRVVVNGVDVTTQVNARANEPLPTLTVAVPEGTALDVSDVESFGSDFVGGPLYVRASHAQQYRSSFVKGLKVRSSGQSKCEISGVTGDVRISTSGQSNIDVNGSLGDVEAEASGQSHIELAGTCRDVEAEASGQSSIRLIGNASGRVHKTASGQASIRIPID